MAIPNDIEAEIYFLTPEEGGRGLPIYGNYRPQFHYKGQYWISALSYPDAEQVNPGDTVRAYLGLLSPDKHLGRVHIGMEFLIREGMRTVGKGIITRIIDLEQSAKSISA